MALTPTWRMEAAAAYLATLQARDLVLERVGGDLKLPLNYSPGELALVRMLKPELIVLLEQEDWSSPKSENQVKGSGSS